MLIKRTTSKPIWIDLYNPADERTPLAGKVPADFSVELSKNTGAFAAATVTVEAVNAGLGKFRFVPSAADTNTHGLLRLNVIVTGAFVDMPRDIQVVAFDPDDPLGLGLTNLDARVSLTSNFTAEDLLNAIFTLDISQVSGESVLSLKNAVKGNVFGFTFDMIAKRLVLNNEDGSPGPVWAPITTTPIPKRSPR